MSETNANGDLGSLVDSMVSAAPPPNEEVIPPVTDSQATPASVTDTAGAVFNPAIHEAMPDGTPRKTIGGKFRRKRGGGGLRPSAPVVSLDVAKEAATSICDFLFVTCKGVFGEHWEPSPGERAQIHTAATRCAIAWGLDLPPGLALTIAVGVYALPRAFDPRTTDKVRSLIRKKRDPQLRLNIPNA